MMRLLAIALLSCVFSFGANPVAEHLMARADTVLKWTDQNPPGQVAGFIVQVSVNGMVLHSIQVKEPCVKLNLLLGKLPPGEYQICISSIGASGLASDPSAPLSVAWIGAGIG